MTRFALTLLLASLAAAPDAALAQSAPTPVMIQLSSETAPPGGVAQVKARTYSPQPVSTGYARLSIESFSLRGIALFSSTGDVVGTAVENGSQVDLHFVSPNGTFGSIGNYPLLALSATVPPNAVSGQQFPVAPDSGSWTMNVRGSLVTVQLQPGSVTVGGSVSITDVIPGGGQLPAGATFSILGVGFSPSTQTYLQGVSASSIHYVNPNRIDVTLRDPAVLDGALIQVVNPDNSSDSYFSYMRGVPVGQSSNPLLAKTVPVFSTNTGTEATLALPAQQANAPDFIAVALQNPGQVSALITLESVSPAGPVTGRTNLMLAPGMKISRDLGELFGSAVAPGGHLHVLSSQPVQVLGMEGYLRAGEVLPAVFSLLPTVFTDIQVTGAAQNGGPAVGSSDTFVWQIKDNQSAISAPGVVFTSYMPDSFRINSVTPTQGTCSVAGQAITCHLGQIGGGATAQVTVNVTPTQSGAFTTSGAVTFTGSDTNPVNNSFLVTIGPK